MNVRIIYLARTKTRLIVGRFRSADNKGSSITKRCGRYVRLFGSAPVTGHTFLGPCVAKTCSLVMDRLLSLSACRRTLSGPPLISNSASTAVLSLTASDSLMRFFSDSETHGKSRRESGPPAHTCDHLVTVELARPRA